MTFGLFFLGEYMNMILLCAMSAILFLGGWLSPIPLRRSPGSPASSGSRLKISLLLFVFSWTKARCPATATTS